MGVLGLSVQDAQLLSIKDVTHALAWHRYERREAWEIAQMLAFYFVQPYDSKKRIKKPQDLFQLPWQGEDIKEALKPENVKKRMERFAKWDAEILANADK